jgi:hypothetical protein
MMFRGFVGAMALHALVIRPHGDERSVRWSRHGETGQKGEHEYRKAPLHIPSLPPTSPTLYLYYSQSSSTKLLS